MANRWGKSGSGDRFSLFGLQNHYSDCSHEIKRRLLLGRKAVTNLDSILKSLQTSLSDKGPYSQSYGFSSNHVQMWELDHKEGWAPKNWWFWTVVLEKTLESPLDCREINPVYLKGSQLWTFIGRTDAEAEAPILSPPDWKRDSLEKTLMLRKTEGKSWGWQRMRWLDSIPDSMDMSLNKLCKKDREAIHGVAKSRTRLSDWTTTIISSPLPPRTNFCKLSPLRMDFLISELRHLDLYA